jgi:hypothetical protein
MNERILELEKRLAQAEQRIAQLEARPVGSITYISTPYYRELPRTEPWRLPGTTFTC